MNKLYHLSEYRLFKRLPCPYCYRHTYKGLEYRRNRSIFLKKLFFKKKIHKRLLAI